MIPQLSLKITGYREKVSLTCLFGHNSSFTRITRGKLSEKNFIGREC